MANRKLTLFFALMFLVSAFVLMNEMFNPKAKDDTEKVNDIGSGSLYKNFIQSIKSESPDELNENPFLEELLSDDNKDASRVFQGEDPEKEKRLIETAQKVISSWAECSSDGTNCGVDTESWEEYFGTGAPPLHQALLRALAVIQVSKAEVNDDDLVIMFQAPSFNLSYAAASLALDRAESDEEKSGLLEKSRALKDKAKALFLEKYANQVEIDDKYIEELSWAVSDKSDVYTRSEIISRIDRLNLNEQQFRFVAFQSCQAVPSGGEEGRRAKLVSLLSRKAQDMGYNIPKDQLCFLPADD